MEMISSKTFVCGPRSRVAGQGFDVQVFDRGEGQDLLLRVLDPNDAASVLAERTYGMGSTDGRDEMLAPDYGQAEAQKSLDACIERLCEVAAARLKARTLKQGLK